MDARNAPHPLDPLELPLRDPRPFSPSDALPFVAAPGGEKPVELRDLDIHVVVSGLLAETTWTLRFFNPNPRDLEGNLVFPLPDGAVVCGYALDVDGRLVDGVVVPRQEARRILEAEQRKGIDPGLVEQVQGNVYRTRIHPVPALGSRTVRITCLGDLVVSGNDAAYHLPLAHADTVESVSLRVEVARGPVAPCVSGGPGGLVLEPREDRWVTEARLGRDLRAEDLLVRLPGLPDHFTAVERTPGGELFFCISSRLPEEADGTFTPRRVAVAWDASGSRTDVERELELLEGLLASWPGVVVDMRVFRHRVEEEATFDTATIRPDAVVAWLRDLPRDGGTSLAALDLAVLPHPEDEAWLLFTDGLGTVGGALPAPGPRPVAVITGQARCDGSLLEHVARRNGGVFVNLVRLPDAAARRSIAGMGDALRVAASTGCGDVHVSTAGGRLAVTGRLEGSAGSVRLAGRGAPDGALGIDADSAVLGTLVARAWAGREARLAALVDGEGSERVLALGRAYGLVTPGTSLLVLETLEQYLEYDLEPPASLPAMVDAFRARRSEAAGDDRERHARHLEGVVALWEQRVAWWERDFRGAWRDARKKRKAKEMEEGCPPQPRSAPSGAGVAPPSPAPCREEAGPMAAFAEPFADAESECMAIQSCCAPPMDLLMECHEAPAPGMAAPAAPAAPAPPALQEEAGLEREGASGAPEAVRASIAVKPWTPDAPYLQALREAEPDRAYRVYLEQRPANAASPAFFFDCADHLLERGERAAGLRVLSNLPELGLDDAALLRMYAWRLQQAGELDGSIDILERVRRMRPDEPQSHRDLGLALGLRWERDRRGDDLERVVELLYEVVGRAWDRFPEIEIIALMELNRLLHLAEREGLAVPDIVDARLRRHLDLDIRISLSWDADLTDVDLHVFEPTGEHAYYAHNLTEIGGLVSRDFRDGYGPEEYVLRHAAPGPYLIKAHYYGSSQQSVTGACTVIATVFTSYGRPDEQKQVLMVRLDRPSHEVLVGEIAIAGGEG